MSLLAPSPTQERERRSYTELQEDERRKQLSLEGNKAAIPPPLISPVAPYIEPHPEAPLFNGEDAVLILQQVASEAAGGNFPFDERFRQLVRQASLVNLWFFLKIVASVAGPFESLTPHLHMDMCNFWQKNTQAGSRGGMWLPRSHYKTSCSTEGGNAHKIIRDPNIRLRISGATYERAQQFMHTIKSLIDSNAFFAWCFPAFVPTKNQKRWNDKEIVVPNRTKAFREPTVYPGGAGGSSEGMHFDGHTLDDPFGEKALNAMRASGTEMENIKNWFWTNLPSLLISPQKSWSFVVGTRYAVDDLYGEIISKANRVEGFPMPDFIPNENGKWVVYYRLAIEEGTIIFPENFSQEDYDQIASDDFWTWATQYENHPQASGLAEFSAYKTKDFSLESQNDEWWIRWEEWNPESDKLEENFSPLSSFDVLMSVDPAATERYVSARTSRSAVGVIATHHSGKIFLIDLKVDYADPLDMIDWLFQLKRKYKGHIRGTFFEMNGGFKVLGPVIKKEENNRDEWLSLRPFPSTTDKTIRIRNELNPILKKGNLYVPEAFASTVREELLGFPQSKKKDILDMLTSGAKNRLVPDSPETVMFIEKQKEAWRGRTNNAAGY